MSRVLAGLKLSTAASSFGFLLSVFLVIVVFRIENSFQKEEYKTVFKNMNETCPKLFSLFFRTKRKFQKL